MADDRPQTTKKSYTPPKNRPTRARNADGTRRRAFGPVAQWITLALSLIVLIAIIIIITNGGDFNPLNDDTGQPTGMPTVVSTGMRTVVSTDAAT